MKAVSYLGFSSNIFNYLTSLYYYFIATSICAALDGISCQLLLLLAYFQDEIPVSVNMFIWPNDPSFQF